ncbi:hypothetical protein EV424DRAFT_797876 [Suillus variegatus]|nr:hypothetical protein EV424DRAFT_797876 [Suillus variegatus]
MKVPKRVVRIFAKLNYCYCMETYEVWADRPTHVYDRPIKVSFGGYKMSISEDFIHVGMKYHKRPFFDDSDDLETCNTYSVRHLVMFLLIEVKPSLSEGSAAVCREVVGPVDLNTPNMIYAAEERKRSKIFTATTCDRHGTRYV